MPEPFVTKVTFKDDQIVLTVEVDKSLAKEAVEISGYATQNSGGFATFYDIQSANENPDGTVVMYVSATPAKAFKNGEDVTVALRAARVWVTVLTESQEEQTPKYHSAAPQGPVAKDGTSWNNIRAVGWASPPPLSTTSAGQTSAASNPSFRPRWPVRPGR